MKPKILIVEDCPLTKVLFERALEKDYALDFSDHGAAALQKIADNNYDLFLLDIMLPDMDGYKICSEIKNNPKHKKIPIFFITSKDKEQDLLFGFQVGADDYIKKPFSPLELKARVDAHLRRLVQEKNSNQEIVMSGLKADPTSHRAYLKIENKWEELKLTSIEFKLLYYFLNHQDQLLTRDQIMNSVWDHATHVSQRTVDTHVSKLRKKLGPASDYIEAIYSEGYRCTVPSAKVAS